MRVAIYVSRKNCQNNITDKVTKELVVGHKNGHLEYRNRNHLAYSCFPSLSPFKPGALRAILRSRDLHYRTANKWFLNLSKMKESGHYPSARLLHVRFGTKVSWVADERELQSNTEWVVVPRV